MTILERSLIVDPWAYAMGYTDTQGIFTIKNYPFPNMTTNLKCCYDSRQDVLHMNRKYNVNINAKEFEQAMSNNPDKHQNEKIDAQQAQNFIEYLYGGVQNLIPDEVKENLLNEILKDLYYEEVSPSKAIKLAVDVFFAGLVEGSPHEGYSWTNQEDPSPDNLGQEDSFKDFFVEAFNRYPEVQSFWKNYLQKNHPGEQLNTDKITVDLILKIANDLAQDETVTHQYSPQNPGTVFSFH